MATKRAQYEIGEFKAAPGGRPGEFTALVSVFGNVDLVGDRVMPGAFTKSLAQWQKSGDPIPIIWSHDWQDPFAHIGYVTSATETNRGLLLSGINDVEKPFAKQVHDLLVSRRVKNWSFFYEIFNEKRARDGANELLELGLIEAGPTLVGCNTSTDTIAAKSLLDAAAALAQEEQIMVEPMYGRKVWIDAEAPGSFEEMRETIGAAAEILLNPTADPNVYVSVQATYPTYALVEVSAEGEDDVTYQVPWSPDVDDAVKLGTPAAVDVTVTVTPKSARKAGARLSAATKNEMQAIYDGIGELQTRVGALMAADDAMKSTAGAHTRDAAPLDTENDATTTESPQAKSIDEDLLVWRTRIEEMCATTGAT